MTIDRRIIKTNDAIKNAFISLAQVEPLNKITVTTLANTANISRKTFYARYKNIDNLVESLENDYLKVFRKTFIFATVTIDHDSQKFFAEYVDFLEDNRDLLKVLIKLNNPTLMESARRDLLPIYKKNLKHSGLFEATDIATIASLTVNFYLAGFSTLMTEWLETDPPISKKTMTQLLVMLFKMPNKT